MKKIILISLIILIFVGVTNISANGIFVNQSVNNLTKMFGSDISYSFIVKNADSFTFYNISIEPNEYITTPMISTLNSGESANITALIIANQSFDLRKFKIKGYYYNTVGMRNLTTNITVDYYSGLSSCDFSIIKGDKVTWKNSVPDDIELKNAVTGNTVTTIPSNQTYTTNFDNPEIFKYYFLRRGFAFTPVCTITVLSDSGLVNNPEYDGILNMSVDVIYNPTTINYNILEHNYTLDVFQSQDGVLTLTNNGNETARNILLSGEWFSFNANNFNLEPGQTKGIVYTIKPMVYNTSDTNKTYNKTLSITGNFVSISSPFNIFVNYANLNNSNQSGNYQSLLELLKQFCKENPNEVFCKDKPSVVYVGNGTDSSFNVTFSQEQVKSIFAYIFAMGDDQKVVNNYMKETMNNLSDQLGEVRLIAQNSSNSIATSEAERQTSSGNITIIVVIFLMITIIAIVIILIIIFKRYKDQQRIKRW